MAKKPPKTERKQVSIQINLDEEAAAGLRRLGALGIKQNHAMKVLVLWFASLSPEEQFVLLSKHASDKISA